MASTTGKKITVSKTATKKADATEKKVESVEETPVETESVETKKSEPKKPVESKKEIRQFNQTDPILCRSVTAGWLGVAGKSGQYYIFENIGDECEIEYQDLFALKSRHSNYIYAPHFVIEDQELLQNPRWADVAKFYDEKLYTNENIDEILNLKFNEFKKAIKELPMGLARSLQIRVSEKIEDGTFDSLNKIKVIDEVFGTDFKSIIAE